MTGATRARVNVSPRSEAIETSATGRPWKRSRTSCERGQPVMSRARTAVPANIIRRRDRASPSSSSPATVQARASMNVPPTEQPFATSTTTPRTIIICGDVEPGRAHGVVDEQQRVAPAVREPCAVQVLALLEGERRADAAGQREHLARLVAHGEGHRHAIAEGQRRRGDDDHEHQGQ